MRCRFLPSETMRQGASAPVGQPQENMVSGGVYDVTPEWAALVNASCPGLDGGPALVPADQPKRKPAKS